MTLDAGRTVRVFVSSTFRDLHEEREELVKRIFPQLRAVCEQRGVAWSEVDLRWGITDEQKAEGRVLPICLAEIDGCRPYFLGILAERYGWVPEAVPPEILEREPWLSGLADRSLTELEILHGVLNDPAAAEHAFFYFRDPGYLDADRDAFGRSAAEGAERGRMLALLKDRIRASGRPLVDGYRTPRELGERVLADLTAVLDRRYPPGSEPDPLQREDAAQAAYEAALRRGFVAREDHVDRVAEHLTAAGGPEQGAPLLVLGPPGAGKSALLADWVARLERQPDGAEPAPVIVRHFVGASPESRDWTVLVRRILAELNTRLDIARPAPREPEALRTALAEWLHTAASRVAVVLVLDAVDQLEDRDGALDLLWLPTELPPGVRVVVSAAAGRPVSVLRNRGWPILSVEPLRVEERIALIREYLRLSGKSLAEVGLRRIATAEACASPLYLRTLLDELRVYGDHLTLDRRVGHYLAAPTIDALYGLVLQRWEQDYERDRPGLVREAFSLLWAARRGLTEAELTDLLGHGDTPLPSHVWSPLLLAARPTLSNVSGRLGFAHETFRDAVQRRYLASPEEQRSAHGRLADYFSFRPVPDPLRAELVASGVPIRGRPFDPEVADRILANRLFPRRVEEHPWQLAKARDWVRLHELLTEPIFLDVAYGGTGQATPAQKVDLLSYWAELEAESAFRIGAAYRPLVERPERYSTGALMTTSILLHDTEHPAEALALAEHLADRSAAAGDLVGYADGLLEQAMNLADLGDDQGAVRTSRQAEAILRRLSTAAARDLLMTCLLNLGGMLGRVDPDSAAAVLREAGELAAQLGNRGVFAASLYSRAVLLKASGDRRGAIALLDRDEPICRERGDLRALAMSLLLRAQLIDAEDPDAALFLLREVEDITRRLGLPGPHLHAVYEQGRIQRVGGRTEEALEIFRKAERLARGRQDRHRQKQGLVHVLGNIGLLLVQRGELAAARPLLDEQEYLCRELDDWFGLMATLGDRALMHVALDEWDEALELVGRQERLCREQDHPRALMLTLTQRAMMLREHGDDHGAVRDLEEAVDLARALADNRQLDLCLDSLIAIGWDGAIPTDPLPLLEERAQVLRILGDDDALWAVLVELATLQMRRGEPDRAAAALDELEGFVRRDGNPADLQRVAELRAMLDNVDEAAGSLCLRANEHKHQGRTDRALELFEQATRRYPDYAFGWADLGICLLEMNRCAEAEPALVRAVDLGADDVATWAPLGAARLLQNDIHGAWECLSVCIEIDVADPGTRRLAAMIHDWFEEVANEPGVPDGMPAVLEELRRIAGR